MKHSLRKSFNVRRRKATPDDEPVSPRLDAHGYSNSNSNLVKPVKSKRFLRRRHRSSSPLPADQTKSKVFEPRYDIHTNDGNEADDDDPFSPSQETRLRPFNRFTNQLRKSFRNTLSRPRPRLESNNSNKRLILNKNDENRPQLATLYPLLSTGLTSPLVIPAEKETIKVSKKRRQAPLAPTHMNHSASCPTDINPDRQPAAFTTDNSRKATANQSFRKRFSFLRKRTPEKTPTPIGTNSEQPNAKLTLGQRFDSLRRSLRIGNRNSSQKGQRYLLSDE